ncbi:MAG: sigma 54-interacting transcriptional regulator [Desulfobacterales bacterium]|nr:sigma 54-interacting transcriptional regulator [Desulfobacterales bacterium]
MKHLTPEKTPMKRIDGLIKLGPDKFQSNHPNDLGCTSYMPHDEMLLAYDSDLEKDREKRIVELKDLTQVLGLILDNVYSGIIFCDRKCNIIFMNQVYAELLGVDRKEAVGKSIFEFFPDSRLPLVVSSGKAELGQRCSLKGEVPFLVNRLPIKRGNDTIGIILQSIFKDYASFKDLVARLNLLETKVKFYKRELKSLLSARYSFDDIKGESSSIREAKRLCSKYASTDAPILILGATGTGKELFAHAIHTASKRANAPFVCVNCAAIPKDLLESELFGYAPGAFTGAHQKGKAGKIEMAHRGTLFLDEMGDLPLNAQAKLLRVLEGKVLERVGDLKRIEVDFRLIAATNKDLRGMISRNEFREELFYRLNTMTVSAPRLTERKGDIPLLLSYFLSAMGKSRIRCTGAAMEILQRYPWPGNVRELKNVIERAVSLIDRDMIDVEHLPSEIITLQYDIKRERGESGKLLSKQLFQCEYNILVEALKLTKGNMSKTARILGVSRSTFYEKCKKHNLLSYNWGSNC